MNYGASASLSAATLPVTGFALNFPLWLVLTTATVVFVALALVSLIRKPGKVKP